MGSLYRRGDSGTNWYAAYVDHTGKRRRRCTDTPNKKTAQQILDHWIDEAAKRRNGLIDPRKERLSAQVNRPIEEHLTEYEAKLQAGGAAPKYVQQVLREIRTAFADAGVQILSDLTTEKIEKHVVALRKPTKKPDIFVDVTPRKRASVVQSVKGFAKWAYESGRIGYHPLAQLKKPGVQRDRKLKRRPFTRPEFDRLIAGLSGVVFGLDPTIRSILYRLAVQTGLRANELRSLQVGQLHLDAKPPFVLVDCGSTKNKQTARQYLTEGLAAEVRKFVGDRSGSLFPVFPADWRLVDVLRHDLTAAGIAHADASGRQIDFHAIRHTCGTWLAQTGVHPKAIQAIMRHSDIRLTIETYGHLFPSQESEAIKSTFGG